MTTTVKVEAHCNPETTVVRLDFSEDGRIDSLILQDGETHQCYVHDSKQVTISEQPRED